MYLRTTSSILTKKTNLRRSKNRERMPYVRRAIWTTVPELVDSDDKRYVEFIVDIKSWPTVPSSLRTYDTPSIPHPPQPPPPTPQESNVSKRVSYALSSIMQGDSTCCRKCVYEALERDFKDRDIRIDVRKEVDVTNLLKRAKDDLKRGNENECFKKLVTVIELLEEPLNGLLEA